MRAPPIPRTALVTGCSTGIGRATALMLHARGWRVCATARRPADLAELAAAGLTAIPLDLHDSASVQAAAQAALAATDGTLGAVVNNAGMGVPGALEDLDRDALRRQFDVNVFGLHELTRACLPAFRRQGAGRIVHVSSVLGRMTIPFMGAYCASKHAVESLADALRVELADTGIAVCLVEPGPIITEFRRNAVANAEQFADIAGSRFGPLFLRELQRRRQSVKRPGFFNHPPESVGRRIVHALESARPRRRYCVTPAAHAGAWLRRLGPDAWVDALLLRRVRRQRAALATPAAPNT